MLLALEMLLLAAVPLLASIKTAIVWGRSNALRQFWLSRKANADLWWARALLLLAVVLGLLVPIVPYNAFLIVVWTLILAAHLYLVAYKI